MSSNGFFKILTIIIIKKTGFRWLASDRKEVYQHMLLGIDIGSITVKVVLLDKSTNLLESYYRRSRGEPISTVIDTLDELFGEYNPEEVEAMGTTGSGGSLFADLLEGDHFNELIAQGETVSRRYPRARTVIELGGQDSKLLVLGDSGGNKEIVDFALNSQCSAGTGSFLDQQAERLGLSIQEFSQLALESEDPPRIAGRCSVFAKSDIIHLQQVGTSQADIVNGLCYAVARNFLGDVAGGKEIRAPVLFQGGVSRNQGMVRAFKDTLGLEEEELIIPRHEVLMSAIGSALLADERGKYPGINWEVQRETLKKKAQTREEVGNRPPLASLDCGDPNEEHVGAKLDFSDKDKFYTATGIERIYLGVDVGSISTNLVAIDEGARPLGRVYLKTAGEPISAVQKGLRRLKRQLKSQMRVKGACVTGSGREMIGSLIGADLIKNEITSQATAAIRMDSDVDTIFEIGGQDSKYIKLDHGTVTDFSMNKACAAGTGSFLEEQAQRLDIDISEFGEVALDSPSPVDLGERCTVFMESDLIHHQQRGVDKQELIAGLAYSIAVNYLNRVVGKKEIGKKVYFQGGVAGNKAVAAAFRQLLEGKEVIVPDHHEVTGAYGAAILAREHRASKENGKSNFFGFDFGSKDFETSTFTCEDCSNRCEIKQVRLDGKKPLFYGSRCGKYDSDGKSDAKHENTGDEGNLEIPDLFSHRNRQFWGEDFRLSEEWSTRLYKSTRDRSEGKIGIPKVLLFWSKFPFWSTFFKTLGYDVVLSKDTDKSLIRESSQNATSETCLPSKIAYGHISNLLNYAREGDGLDYLFLPAMVSNDHDNTDTRTNYNCPLVQGLPYISNGQFDFERSDYPVELITQAFHFYSDKRLRGELRNLGRKLGKNRAEVSKALSDARKAEAAAKNNCLEMGKQVLEKLGPSRRGLVVMSRSYNGCDSGLNMKIPEKLRQLGVVPIPIDCLPVEEINPDDLHQEMQWDWGKRILSAATFIKEHPHLYGLYLSHFRCGPDSFIIRYAREILEEEPFLHLELDEHSADAGIVTRCEAFLDSLRQREGGLKKVGVRERLCYI
ncbi:MAG: acyl-CoA dehydratase activase [Candidatus Bipolaricaulota bacterium]